MPPSPATIQFFPRAASLFEPEQDACRQRERRSLPAFFAKRFPTERKLGPFFIANVGQCVQILRGALDDAERSEAAAVRLEVEDNCRHPSHYAAGSRARRE